MELEAFINGDRQKRAKKRSRTLRLVVDLAPPTEDYTNEFSYTELVEGAREKVPGRPEVGDTLHEGPDNQLAALAQKLEEKYGAPGLTKKKKRRVFESDLIDRGYGYDTNDSFVDDSEMYEDFVPPQVDTKFGGFYVNTGDLEFKRVWQTEEDEDMDTLMKKKKPKMKKQSSHQTPQSILANQKLKKAKQHVAAQKVPKPKSSKVLFKTISLAAPSSSTSSSVLSKSPHKKAASVSAKKKEKAAGDQSLMEHTPSLDTSLGSMAVSTGPVAGEKSETGGEQGKRVGEGAESQRSPPVLPSDLPEAIATSIQQFEESVARDQASTPEGKMSIKIRGSYDEQLAELELACRKLQTKKRVAVLEYVSHKLGVSRATTIKRIRQVMKKREEEALAHPLQKLKEAVDASMPEQLQQYEQELRARAESLSAAGADKVSVVPMEVDDDVTVDEVFEESLTAVSETKETTAKAKRAPRKKYKWTEETRQLLCEVVKVKVVSEELMKGRANGEEILMEFLDMKVKPLWPKGWMQKSILYKMTESVHKHFTNPQSKKATPTSTTRKPDREKPTDQKKEARPDVPPSSTPTTKKLPETSPHTSLLVPPSPSASKPTPHALKESVVENVQWSVKTGSSSTGSPITIVRKTPTTATSGAGGRTDIASGVEITPRMAQILSSVASTQALLKTAKPSPGLLGKAPTGRSPPAKKSEKLEKLRKVAMHSDVQALLSQFQSGPVKFPELSSVKLPSTATDTSSARPSSTSVSQGLTQTASSSPTSKEVGAVRASSHTVSSSSVGSCKLTSSKITTSPIQMKAIVSHLKPKSAPQAKVAPTPSPKQASLSPTATHKKAQPQTKSVASSLSLTSAATPSVLSKLKKSTVASSTGPTLQLPRITGAFSMTEKPYEPSRLLASGQQGSPLGQFKQPEVGHSKKGSPLKVVKARESYTKPHPQTTPTAKRVEHSVVQRSRIGSTSPLTTSHSSSPLSSSSSPLSHLPLSAIVQQPSPSFHTPSTAPSPSHVPLSSTAIGSSRSSTSSTLATLEGTPITAILLQQQPTYVVSSRPQLVTHQTIVGGSTDIATTIPFSSCASTYILTSPLTGSHFGQQHTTKTTPLNTQHHLQQQQAPPPRTLTISPPGIPLAGAQVIVGGASGSGVKSPVEQIYMEHSYGGQTEPVSNVEKDSGGLSVRKLQQ